MSMAHPSGVGSPLIDEKSAPVVAEDLVWFERVEPALKLGAALRSWWEEKTGSWTDDVDHDRLKQIIESDFHPRSFLLTRPSPQWPRNLCYGFYDQVTVDGREIPVLGRFQQVFFDRPRIDPEEASAWEEPQYDNLHRRWCKNLQTYVSDDVLRRGSFENFFVAQPDERRPLAAYLRPLSLSAAAEDHMLERGLVSSQLYYRRLDGQFGKFWPSDRRGLDLDDLDRCKWIIAHFRPQPAKLFLRLTSGSMPYIGIPFDSSRVGVLRAEDLIGDSCGSDGGCRYGMSYYLLGNPSRGRLMGGFETLIYLVKGDGETLCQSTSVNYHPTWLTARAPDPALWVCDQIEHWSRGFLAPLVAPLREYVDRLPSGHSLDFLLFLMDALESATGGLTVRQMGLSRQNLERRLLTADAISVMKTVIELSNLWRLAYGWNRSSAGEPPR